MTVQTCEFTYPAFLASAFVNGDVSGLTDAEAADFEAKRAALASEGWQIVDVKRDAEGNAEESRFTWSYRLYGGDAEGGDVIDFIAHRTR